MKNKKSIDFGNQDLNLQQNQSEGLVNKISDLSNRLPQDPQDIPLADLNPSRMSESELLTEDYERESVDEYVRLYLSLIHI